MKNYIGKSTSGSLAERIVRPFQTFTQVEASGGILLFACAVIALIWANSPWLASYTQLWEIHFRIGLQEFVIDEPLHLWINDGLMVIFFFLMGLEIKREVLVGELSTFRKALLPIIAAVGGMLFPALIYFAFNKGTPPISGWAIPTATDIAFALGVLTLLGERVPVALKVFLTAFAIVDDIGAVLVIAIFYHAAFNLVSLLVAAGIFLLLCIVGTIGVRLLLVYILLGIALWLAFLLSGVHTTIAGVLVALTIPSRARIDASRFVTRGRDYLNEVTADDTRAIGLFLSERQEAAIQSLETLSMQSLSPLQRFEHAVNPWVAYFILPLFALANAGVTINSSSFAGLASPVALGVFLGLLLGKQIGITLFSWIAVKLGWADLPEDSSWWHIYGISWLGGIGFTMSLFIADLAFGETQGDYYVQAKLGILLAALVAGVGGWLILWRTSRAMEKG